jgi:hypothetical protein
MSDFLGQLASQMASQLSLGENQTHDLDAVIDGSNVKYGALGDFAKVIDQSAERRYVEEGYLRWDPYNTTPKQFEILMQEPSATILVKKRMFSSIADNFRPDFMNNDEKLYYKATRILFQNKCNQIAALEKLAKIAQITAATGSISDQLIPIIITLADQINYGGPLSRVPFSSGLFGSLPDSNPYSTNSVGVFASVIDKIRKIYAFNSSAQYTSWIVDNMNLFQSTLGQGTGVIEITNFTNLNTNVTVDMESGGNFNFTISDPYEAMVITDYDIEIALSDATNLFYNNKTFQFGTQSADHIIQTKKAQLNQVRANRNASPLTINVDPNTVLSNRVTVIVDRLGKELVFSYNASGGVFPGLGGSGNSVSVSPDYLQGGAALGYDGLSTSHQTNPIPGIGNESELDLFKALIAAIYNKIQMDANSQNAFQNTNVNTNYARRKLRFNFSGQLIIQPMDVVHIYINSKSRFDTKVLSGLNNYLSGLGILQNLNNTITDFENSFDALFRPSGSIPLQVEKVAFVGQNFPNFLWALMRGNFVSENEGTHVFAGLVDSVSDNWRDGKFMIDVRGKDNSLYFEQGKVNFKPAADVFNGSWFDPLTPFQTSFDTISSDYTSQTPTLLAENQAILSTPTVKSKLGPFAGVTMTTPNMIQDKSIDPLTGLVTQTFYAPDGLVYTWREGIGVFTQAGLSTNINDPNRVGSPNIYQEPFAGQDVMNVLSLLITGVPYNFATFYRGVLGDGKYGLDPHTNLSGAFAFINSLTKQLRKNNTLWGNFIPFKSLSVDESSYVVAQLNQFTITQYNKQLDQQIAKLQTLQQQSVLFEAVKNYAPGFPTANPNFVDVSTQIANLTKDINNTITNIKNQQSSFYRQVGNDPSFDYSAFIDSGSINNAITDPQIRQQLRKKINFITRRMSYNVRANEDKNLFIVDDYYDKDYDILAFESSINNNFKSWNNEFTSVKEKIISVAKLLNLEVFCDTQGHIRVRPPQYNRMPSSVFYRMMYLKQTLGIQIFPNYLNQLFTDQLEGLKTQIEIIEDEIRLDTDLITIANGSSNFSDDHATFYINSGISYGSGQFVFLTDRATGTLTDVNALVQQANSDVVQNQIPTSLASYSLIASQAGLNNIFNNIARYTTINSTIQAQKQAQSGNNVVSNTVTSNTDVNMLINRIQQKSGQKLNPSDYIVNGLNNIKDIVLPANQTIDIFKTTADLQAKISQRQKIVKLFYSTLTNMAELKSLDTDSSVSNQLVTPGGYGNTNIPEVFEHMIEDESYDDYGPGSGSRYIIKRSQIYSISIAANPPPYTYIEVQGILDPYLADPSSLPQDLNFFPLGGNGMVTAAAIDYDMWRNYGFKGQSSIQVPFLSDPIKQCGPYAAMLLSVARKNIFRGSVTISGNEFMQPGEVVFLEDRGMLFYVTSVQHNFTEGASFTTTLELTYGHTPGEYIPTVMDFIGKLIYKNKNDGSFVIQRQDNSGNEVNIATFTMAPNNDVNSKALSNALNAGGADQTPNPTSEFNSKELANLLWQAAYEINQNGTDGNNVETSIEIRIYSDNDEPDPFVYQFAENIKSQIAGFSSGPKNSSPFSTSIDDIDTAIPDYYISIELVNLLDTTDRRSPSQKAWNAARNILANSNSGSLNPASNDALRKALFSYIVDVWIVRTPVNSQTSSGV